MLIKQLGNYQKITLDKTQYIFERLAQISFGIFIFFIFFNTRIPFKERTRDIEAITTSNPINQIVYGTLFIISLLLIYYKKNDAIKFIKREKYFFIFLSWCFLTILWSDHSVVSLKRFIQFFTTVSVPLAFLLYAKNSEQAVKIFYYILIAYVLISFATIFTVPLARNQSGYWRGIHTDKNGFAQISLIALIFFCIHFSKSVSLKSKMLDVFLILLSFTLLVGARSSTALIAFLILFSIWVLFQIDKLFEPIGIGKTISVFLILFGVFFVSFILFFVPEKLESIIGVTGKDLTFTGRVDIWKDIWIYVESHFLLGAGFRGFWVINSPRLEELYQMYIWLPIQSHNGYLDLLNEVGAIGASLFLVVLINYFFNLSKLRTKQVWKWFVVAAIILNITETTLITPKSVTGVMFIFAYLALFKDSITLEESEVIIDPNKKNSLSRYSSVRLYK